MSQLTPQFCPRRGSCPGANRQLTANNTSSGSFADLDADARVKIGVTINDDLWRRLRAYAMLEGRAAAEVLDEAIAEYLKRNKRK